ncbi:MAG: hypothetical protein ACHQUC_05910 [Chlamydiales bacterium]
MDVRNNLEFCENYFNSFADLFQCASLGRTLKGIGKILSYSLIIPPLVIAYKYFQYRKIAQINAFKDGLDNLLSCSSNPLKIYKLVFPEKQKELLNYLTNKAAEIKTNGANHDLEKTRFQKGFRLLSFDQQKDFFAMAIQANVLSNVLALIPNDISELNFTSGPVRHPFGNDSQQREYAELLVDKLKQLTHVKKLHLDLTGLGLYCQGVHHKVLTANKFENVFANFSSSSTLHSYTRSVRDYGILTFHTDNVEIIFKTLQQSREMSRKDHELELFVQFYNYDVRVNRDSISGGPKGDIHLVRHHELSSTLAGFFFPLRRS